MDDLKSVTVSYLRDLARKHLGPGYSKLTKTELIAALAHVVPALKKLAEAAGIAVSRPARKPERKQESAKKVPAKKPEPERKKEPEGKKVAQKKNPEGKKGSQKKEPEAKKAVEKKEPAKKAAPPPQQKAAPAQQKKAPAPPEPKKVAPTEPKAPAQTEPKGATPSIEQKDAPKPNATPPPEQKPATPRERKPTSGRSAATKSEELAQSLRPARIVNFPPRPRAYRSADGSWNEDPADTAAERATAASQPAEPLLEGFFVARVVGERELRRHHLTEAQAPRGVTSNATGYEENLGELPVDYESDVATALARDPHTLFVSWDFTPATRARAMEGLDSPRPVLRVYEGDKLVRVEEFALESRSFYIHGLPPGRSYRVEAHFVSRDGRSRRIGPSTHPVRLPQAGLSQDTAVRFLRMPPPPPPAVRAVAQQPLAAPPEPTPPSFIDEGEFITWHRIHLPSSADVAEVLESRRERVQRHAAAPAEIARPAHLQISARPLGASELAAARGLRLGGASEQIHWTPPPSGRGR